MIVAVLVVKIISYLIIIPHIQLSYKITLACSKRWIWIVDFHFCRICSSKPKFNNACFIKLIWPYHCRFPVTLLKADYLTAMNILIKHIFNRFWCMTFLLTCTFVARATISTCTSFSLLRLIFLHLNLHYFYLLFKLFKFLRRKTC